MGRRLVLAAAALLLLGQGLQAETQASGQRNAGTLAQTAAAQTIRFVSFGDFGTGAREQYRVAQAIENTCKAKGCDFAVTLGDNIYNNGVSGLSDSQFQTKFEQPYARLDFRFHLVLGNHDYRGNVDAQVAYTQQSKKWYLPSRYYHFNAGPASFFALDTNQGFEAQIGYFNKALQQSDRPWKIVFGHHPRHTNGYYKNSLSAAQIKLLDSFCGQADIYLSGHEHNKQHLQTGCLPDYLVVGTGAGYRAGASGPGTRFYKPTFGFAWFEVSPTRLHFELYNNQGQQEYSYTRHKDSKKS